MKTPQNSSTSLRLALCLSLAFSLAYASGCSSAKKSGDVEDEISESSIPATVNADDNSATGDSDSGRAMGLQTVHFPYDSFTLDDAGKETLKANADIMKANATINVQIEGHCDQRGGTQYNIALGEKRAGAAKKYMESLEIPAARITTISFGKEKPIMPGDSEEANAKNRRGNFVITSK